MKSFASLEVGRLTRPSKCMTLAGSTRTPPNVIVWARIHDPRTYICSNYSWHEPMLTPPTVSNVSFMWCQPHHGATREPSEISIVLRRDRGHHGKCSTLLTTVANLIMGHGTTREPSESVILRQDRGHHGKCSTSSVTIANLIMGHGAARVPSEGVFLRQDRSHHGKCITPSATIANKSTRSTPATSRTGPTGPRIIG
jgi:hypothetical protein